VPQYRRFTRIAVLALAVPTAFALASCSSSTAGKGSTSSPPATTGAAGTGAGTTPTGTGAPSSKTGSSVPGEKPTDGAGLAALMQRSIAGTTSAHIQMDISAAGQNITGHGDEKLANGKVTAMDITEEIGSVGSLRMIIIDGKVYVQLPSSLNQSGKPWQLASANSSNPVLKQLSSTITSIQSSASVGSTTVFAKAASSVSPKKSENVDGVAADHYSVVVDVNNLPDSYPGKTTLVSAGLTKLPVELWIDGKGRPVQVTEKLSVSGQEATTKVAISKYNEPVTISAPPAAQVSTS
jgi:hypothetical protein